MFLAKKLLLSALHGTINRFYFYMFCIIAIISNAEFYNSVRRANLPKYTHRKKKFRKRAADFASGYCYENLAPGLAEFDTMAALRRISDPHFML